MDTFAFIIHPIDPKRDVSRKFPLLRRLLNERQIKVLNRLLDGFEGKLTTSKWAKIA